MAFAPVLALCLGASPAPFVPASPAASPLGDPRCTAATQPIAAYEALATDPETPDDDVIAAARSVSLAYDHCAVFSSVRGNNEDARLMLVRAAQYRYYAGDRYFEAGDYAQARAELNAARGMLKDTIAVQPPSRYRAFALSVRDAADALIQKIPVPTGISTAPATVPATIPPTVAPKPSGKTT